VVGQNPSYSGDLVDWIIPSLRHSTEDWLVINQIVNPKKPDLKLAQYWQERSKGTVLERCEFKIPEEYINIPDLLDKIILAACTRLIVVSVFSTTLRVAAFAGQIPVFVSTEATRRGMLESTGIGNYYPLAQMGAAVTAAQTLDLSTIASGTRREELVEAQQEWLKETAWQPDIVASAITELVNG
jgi:hypothetical protein